MTAMAFPALAPGAPMGLGHTLEMASPGKSTKPHIVTCEPERSQKSLGSKPLSSEECPPNASNLHHCQGSLLLEGYPACRPAWGGPRGGPPSHPPGWGPPGRGGYPGGPRPPGGRTPGRGRAMPGRNSAQQVRPCRFMPLILQSADTLSSFFLLGGVL